MILIFQSDMHMMKSEKSSSVIKRAASCQYFCDKFGQSKIKIRSIYINNVVSGDIVCLPMLVIVFFPKLLSSFFRNSRQKTSRLMITSRSQHAPMFEVASAGVFLEVCIHLWSRQCFHAKVMHAVSCLSNQARHLNTFFILPK